jgi:UrcA family protein
MKSVFTSVCLVACVAVAVASTARAQPSASAEGGQVSRTVHLGDIDLHTQAGAREAARRIHIAADFVCGGDSTLWRQDADFDTCRNGAIDRALSTLRSPLVSAALGRQTPTGLAVR